MYISACKPSRSDTNTIIKIADKTIQQQNILSYESVTVAFTF